MRRAVAGIVFGIAIAGCSAEPGPGPDAVELPGCEIVADTGPDPGAPPNPLTHYIATREKACQVWRELRVLCRGSRESAATHFSDSVFAENGLVISRELRSRVLLGCERTLLGYQRFETIYSHEATALEAIRCFCDANNLGWYVDLQGRTIIIKRTKETVIPELVTQAETFDDIRRQVLSESFGCQLEDYRRLRDCRLEHDWDAVSLYDLIDLIQETAKVNIVIAADVRRSGLPDRIGSYQLRGRSALEVLEEAGKRFGLAAESRSELILLVAGSAGPRAEFWKDRNGGVPVPEELEFLARTVQLSGTRLTLREVAQKLGAESGVPVLVDDVSWKRSARYTLDRRERSVADVVALLGRGARVTVRYLQGHLVFLEPLPER